MNGQPSNGLKAGQWLWLALGVGIGAAAMYMFNPNRKGGTLQHNTSPKPRPLPAVADHILEERVKQEFHRKIPNAKAIRIEVSEGIVKVSGPILVDEVDKLISCIQAVPGVQRVEDHLQAHQTQQGYVKGEGPYLQ